MRGVPRTQLDRSDLLASGAVVCAANLVALAEALFDLNARDPRDRHLVRGLDELGLEAEAAQDGWCNPVPLEIERCDADERSELPHSRDRFGFRNQVPLGIRSNSLDHQVPDFTSGSCSTLQNEIRTAE